MRKHIYTTLTGEEYSLLNEIVQNAGFASRTEYFTEVAKATIYGIETGKWIEKIRTRTTDRTRIAETFFAILGELAFPVIAMKGSRTALNALADGLRAEMYSRIGIIPCEDELNELAREYEMLFRPEFAAYRAEIHAETTRGGAP